MATLISALSTLTGSINNNTNVFPVLDQTISSSANRNKKARITTHNLFYSNNTTVGSLSSYDNYFGTGTDGDCTISSSAQISSSTSPAGLNNISREFGDIIVKNFKNLTINGGLLFSPLRACRGLVIYCTGDLTVNGTISMTGKGGGVGSKIAAPIGIASSTDSRYDLVDATLYFNNFSSSATGTIGHMNWAPSGSAWFSNYKIRVPLSGSVAGGAGGIQQTSTPFTGIGGTGTAGIFCCGGGGGGGASNYYNGGAGGRGTIFSAGGGGGGSGNGPGGQTGGSSAAFEVGGGGGAGWAGIQGGGGGGAGSPTGPAGSGRNDPPATNGGIGVGGLLILIVRGNITINGTVSNNGSAGGNGGGPSGGAGSGAGGGGSGGGRTIIIYGGTYTNAGSVVASGGSAGVGPGYGPGGGSPGGAGGAGAITLRKVHI
jgi:hypothetical protein